MEKGKWVSITIVGVVLSMASCEAITVSTRTNANVELAKIECVKEKESD